MSLLDIASEKFKSSSKVAIGRFCEVRKLTYYGSGNYERTLAFKTPLPHLKDDKDVLRSLEVEAALLSRISHPNVVSVIDFSRERERVGILMDLVSGMDLKRVSDQNPILPPEPLLMIALRMAWALDGIHNLSSVSGNFNVIHRDISLGNVMISEWGDVKIVDFGSSTSKQFPQEASEALFRGRFSYLPPEYLMGQSVDQRLDIFSLGVCLYRLASGVFPFVGEERNDLVYQMLRKTPERPSRLNRKLGGREDKLIMRCLHPNPEKRFEDHQEMHDFIQYAMRKRRVREHPQALAQLVRSPGKARGS